VTFVPPPVRTPPMTRILPLIANVVLSVWLLEIGMSAKRVQALVAGL
jgi:hypothetical protein